MPDTEIRFVGKEAGPVVTEGSALLLGATYTLTETLSPGIVVVPGEMTSLRQMVEDEVLDWLRKVHQTTIWTVSVYTGALILAAASILKGLPATTTTLVQVMGAQPKPGERIVHRGNNPRSMRWNDRYTGFQIKTDCGLNSMSAGVIDLKG